MVFSFIVQSCLEELVALGDTRATSGQEADLKNQETQVSGDPGTFPPALGCVSALRL